MSKLNTTSAHLSHSLFRKPYFYLNTPVLSQKSASVKSAFLGAKAVSQSQSYKGRYCWTLPGQKMFLFSHPGKKLFKLLEKEIQYDVYPCLQMFNQCPFRGSCAYKQHRGNYIHCCKEQMCKFMASWGENNTKSTFQKCTQCGAAVTFCAKVSFVSIAARAHIEWILKFSRPPSKQVQGLLENDSVWCI